MIKNLAHTLTILTSLAAPLAAQSTYGSPISGEFLDGWQQADGTRVAALKLTLKPGWKTYWRSPGDAGIPPQFDWSESANLEGVNISWPAPGVFPQNGMRTIAYKDEVLLPLTIKPKRNGKSVTLKLALDLGVCRDICVPFQMDLSAILDGTSSTPTPAIAAALAARPFSAKEAGVTSATCTLRPNAEGLEIETRLKMRSTGRREVVVIEPNQPNIWMSETDSRRRGGTLISTGDMVAANGGTLAIDRSAITITVLGRKQAVEIKGCTPG